MSVEEKGRRGFVSVDGEWGGVREHDPTLAATWTESGAMDIAGPTFEPSLSRLGQVYLSTEGVMLVGLLADERLIFGWDGVGQRVSWGVLWSLGKLIGQLSNRPTG